MKVLIEPRPIQEREQINLDKERTFDIMKLYKPYDFFNMVTKKINE